MAVSDLNIALRLDSREFEAGIRRAERAMSRASANLTGIGNSLAIAFTAPLAAIGISAIKSAGQFEQLQRAMEATMTGAGYSIRATTEEIEKLREVAKAPGIDFKGAVAASIRLQSVGLSADKARQAIIEFANGVAAAGGTGENLESVTVQLAQMIAKGKVFTQDLKIIKENMPSISRVMVDAFGTADAEGIQKLNISAREFVDTIVEKLKDTPRVVGGLTNSMVNAQVSIQQAAAKLGDTLNKTFNISGNLDAFGTWIVDMADRFAALDEGTQRLIIGVGLFAAALGPAIRFGGILVNTVSSAVTAAYSLVGAFARASSAGTGLIGVIKGIDLAAKLTILGAAVGVALALAVALKAMNSEASQTAKIQNTVERAMLDAAATVEQQKTKVELLAGVVKDVTKTEKERNAALGELNRIIPATNGLTIQQTDLTEKLDKATGNYIDTLIRQAKAQAAAAAIGANATKKAQLELDKAQLRGGGGPRAGAFIGAENARKKAAIDSEIRQLNALDVEYKKIIETTGGVVAAVTSSTKPFDDNTKALKDQGKAAEESADELSRITEELLRLNEFDANKVNAGVPPTIPSGGGLGNTEYGVSLAQVEPLNQTKTALDKVAASLGVTSEAWVKYKANVDSALLSTNKTRESQELLTSVVGAVGDAIVQASADGKASLADFANAAVRAAARIIGAEIRVGVTTVVAKAFKSAPYPLNLILGPLAGIAAQGIFNAAINRITTPHMAEGGLAFGQTLAVVGEYKGASSNPEVIAPLSKLESMINRSSGTQYLYSIISGDDIILVSDRAREKRSRYR